MESDNLLKKKQLKLSAFCKEFDVPRTTALKWIHSKGFPAYNICGHWYVDVLEFHTWRENQHRKSANFT